MSARIPDSTSVREQFDAEAEEYVRSRETQYSFCCQKRLVLELLADAAGSPPGRALDIGCGPAVMEEALVARGFKVHGVDLSLRMIEQGKARAAARGLDCTFEVGDVTRLAAADGSFDAVLAMGVLEYLPDYEAALREIHRVLRPGGVVALTVPNRRSPYHAARRAYAALRKLAGRSSGGGTLAVNSCVPRRLDRQLEALGFRGLERRGCNFIFFPLHDKLPRASVALNRALWPLARTPLGPLLGAQYVVKARKR